MKCAPQGARHDAESPMTVEWRVEPGLQPYEDAVRGMEERVAAIRAGSADELAWLVEHPPLYTAGTSARKEDLLAPGRFPGPRDGAGRRVHLSRPRSAGGLSHARPRLTRPRRPAVRPFHRGVADRHPGGVRHRRGTPRGTGRHLGRTPRRRGQDRGGRAPPAALDQLSRRVAERRAGPVALRRHRALRHRRARGDLPRGDLGVAASMEEVDSALLRRFAAVFGERPKEPVPAESTNRKAG